MMFPGANREPEDHRETIGQHFPQKTIGLCQSRLFCLLQKLSMKNGFCLKCLALLKFQRHRGHNGLKYLRIKQLILAHQKYQNGIQNTDMKNMYN